MIDSVEVLPIFYEGIKSKGMSVMKKQNMNVMNNVLTVCIDSMLGLVRSDFGFDFIGKESNYAPKTGLLDEHYVLLNGRMRC